MTWVRFVLVGEGNLEGALVDHLERLLIWVGASEVSGVWPDLSRVRGVGADVASKIRAAQILEPGANLIFVHRDADSRDATNRRTEILDALTQAAPAMRSVPVVPIQETEAWLLLSETEIRRAAGRPSGTAALNLPSPRRVEHIASPKEVLQQALINASEATGRTRSRFVARIPILKAQMLRRLPIEGEIEQLTAWVELRRNCETAVRYL